MSKKGFSVATKGSKQTPADVDVGEDDPDPDVRIKKISRDSDAQMAQQVQKKSSGGYTFTGITPGKAYIHPPSRLIDGRVMYPCKYLGHLKVPEPRGKQIIYDAIDKLVTVATVNKANMDEDLLEVELSISIRSISTINKSTKKSTHQHPLPLISFSADDKRGNCNMFAYIARGKPPTTDHICYVYQCSPKQAREITATVGQAFELAYKKFLETKQAQEDFKKLVEMLKTASPQERVEIEKKLVEVNKIRAAEAERQKKMAAIQAKMPEPYAKPVTKITVKGTQGAGMYTGSGKEEATMFEGGKEDPELAEQLEKVQKEVKQLEIDSEHQRQQARKMQRNTSSVEAKWENITMALEPFQMEPSLDPETQYLVKRQETKELDSAIGNIEKQIQDLEDAFDWHRRKGQGPVPNLYEYEEEESEEKPSGKDAADAVMKSVDGQVWLAKVDAESMEIPDLPANYVMDEFVKAREQAALPAKGSVKSAAGSWYKEHHD